MLMLVPVAFGRAGVANARAQLEIIDGMNHVLKEVRDASKQMDSYGNPSLPLHHTLVEVLGRALKASQKSEH